MNSLRMYVEDATGGKFLFTLATNRPGVASQFRRHAGWWRCGGYKHAPIEKQPAFPVRVVIEEYQDETAP